MYQTIEEAVKHVAEYAERERMVRKETKEWTTGKDSSCETIRVPVSLLNRIRDMRELLPSA